MFYFCRLPERKGIIDDAALQRALGRDLSPDAIATMIQDSASGEPLEVLTRRSAINISINQ